jgi:hypothetical protein
MFAVSGQTPKISKLMLIGPVESHPSRLIVDMRIQISRRRNLKDREIFIWRNIQLLEV